MARFRSCDCGRYPPLRRELPFAAPCRFRWKTSVYATRLRLRDCTWDRGYHQTVHINSLIRRNRRNHKDDRHNTLNLDIAPRIHIPGNRNLPVAFSCANPFVSFRCAAVDLRRYAQERPTLSELVYASARSYQSLLVPLARTWQGPERASARRAIICRLLSEVPSAPGFEPTGRIAQAI